MRKKISKTFALVLSVMLVATQIIVPAFAVETASEYFCTCDEPVVTDNVETANPTCTEKGYKTYLCDECGKTVASKTEVLDEINHDFDYENPVYKYKAATCLAEGRYATVKCTVCDSVGVAYNFAEEGKISNAHDNYTIVKDITESVITKLPHTPYPFNGREPTCTAPGHEIFYYCVVCRKTEVTETGEVIKVWTQFGGQWAPQSIRDKILEDENHDKYLAPIATNHTWSELVDEVPASCVQTGIKAHYVCKNEGCGVIAIDVEDNKVVVSEEELIIDRITTHNVEVVFTDATCEADAFTVRTCHTEGCKWKEVPVTETHEGTKDAHIAENKKHYDAQELTCYDDGIYAFDFCEVCGKVSYIDVENNNTPVTKEAADLDAAKAAATFGAAYNHDGFEVVMSKKDPTCTEDGYDAGAMCTNCGEILNGMDPMAKLKHNFTNRIGEIPAMCQGEGAEARGQKECYKCVRCDALRLIKGEGLTPSTLDELSILEVPMEHYDADRRTHSHTCTEDGYFEYICTNPGHGDNGKCNYAWTAINEEDPAAHLDAINLSYQAAKCTADGWNAFVYCTECKTATYIGEEGEEVVLEDVADAEAAKQLEGIKLPKTNHNDDYENKAEIPAQYGKDGHEAGKWCNICKEYVDNSKVIPAYNQSVTFSLKTSGLNGAVKTVNSGKLYLDLILTVNKDANAPEELEAKAFISNIVTKIAVDGEGLTFKGMETIDAFANTLHSGASFNNGTLKVILNTASDVEYTGSTVIAIIEFDIADTVAAASDAFVFTLDDEELTFGEDIIQKGEYDGTTTVANNTDATAVIDLVKLGDAVEDGEYKANDFAALDEYMADYENIEINYAEIGYVFDMNRNGEVDIDDYNLLLNAALN